MVSALSAAHFHSEEAAFAYVEARVWPEGPICPHCGGYDRIGKMGRYYIWHTQAEKGVLNEHL